MQEQRVSSGSIPKRSMPSRFPLNAAICGAAGAIIVMVWVISAVYMALPIRCVLSSLLRAAGLGNLPGVIAAGLGIGALEQYGAPHLRDRLSAGRGRLAAHHCADLSVNSAATCPQESAIGVYDDKENPVLCSHFADYPCWLRSCFRIFGHSLRPSG